MNRRSATLGGLGLMATAFLPVTGAALAQGSYPDHPIRLIVANPAGGIGDVLSRFFGEEATTVLGQPFVVENRPGASTVIGTQFVARSAPDGYTILNLTTSGLVQTVLRSNLPYNVEKDFTPIIGIGSSALVIAVSTSSGIQTLDDLRVAAKSPKGVTYGSGGTGTIAHLASVTLMTALGGKGVHVPYRGNSEAIKDLLGGQIQLFLPSVTEVLQLRDSLRLLAITSQQRFAGLPDVPTMTELGLPAIDAKLWFAFLAPAKTPAAILERLYTAFAKAKDDAALSNKLTGYGFDMQILDPAACSAYMREETARWGAVVRANDIHVGD